MIILLSPAKTLDESPLETSTCSSPIMLTDAQILLGQMKKKSVLDLQNLMNISEKLAEMNVNRFQNFENQASKAALYLFKGDVYVGLSVTDFSKKNVEFAQNHLRILSGLYGILKPLDSIKPYRLEMGTSLANRRGKNLYEFWGSKIAKRINEDLEQSNSLAVLNLASEEYFKAVHSKQIKKPIITAIFKENKNGKLQVISFLAKKARGMMARYVIQEEIVRPEDLKHFKEGGYAFNAELSNELEYVFTR